MKIWWLLSAENRRESANVGTFVGSYGFFPALGELAISTVSPTCNILTFQEGLAKKGPVLNQMLDQQTFYKDLKMVNQMIPRTISTPKNFLDQACLAVLKNPAF